MIVLPLVSFRPILLGGLAFISYSALPIIARAQDPDLAPEVINAPLSTDGKPLLAATVFIAATLVGMERFCSWRLRVRHRQASGLQPILAECLPPAVELTTRFAPAPES